MPTVPDPSRFARALTTYFGDDTSPGYSPTDALDGNARISAEFPAHAADLIAQIDQMFASAFGLPGLDGLALDEAMAAIREFIAAEYDFLPSLLQAKVVNCCGYGLWK
jgi:hypothetical protein